MNERPGVHRWAWTSTDTATKGCPQIDTDTHGYGNGGRGELRNTRKARKGTVGLRIRQRRDGKGKPQMDTDTHGCGNGWRGELRNTRKARKRTVGRGYGNDGGVHRSTQIRTDAVTAERQGEDAEGHCDGEGCRGKACLAHYEDGRGATLSARRRILIGVRSGAPSGRGDNRPALQCRYCARPLCARPVGTR